MFLLSNQREPLLSYPYNIFHNPNKILSKCRNTSNRKNCLQVIHRRHLIDPNLETLQQYVIYIYIQEINSFTDYIYNYFNYVKTYLWIAPHYKLCSKWVSTLWKNFTCQICKKSFGHIVLEICWWYIWLEMYTYFPKAVNKIWTLSESFFCVNGMLMTSFFIDRRRIACKRPCGAISIVIALWWISFEVSSKSTGFCKTIYNVFPRHE